MAVDNIALPDGSHARRVFGTVVVLGTVALLGLRFLAIPAVFGTSPPEWSKVLDDTLANVIATVLAATILSATVIALLPKPRSKPTLEVLPPREIGGELRNALATTTSWRFSGSVGRWCRAVALPELAQKARESGGVRTVTMLVLDPMNDDLVQQYASYRGGLRTETSAAWTPNRVRQDIYATIACAYAIQTDQPQLRVEVFVKPSSSVLRYDMADQYVVVTREDPLESALKCDQGTFLFESFSRDIDYAQRQSRRLPDVSTPGLSSFDRTAARNLFVGLGLDHPSLSDDHLVDSIVLEARSHDNPY